jgi:succinate dehydrogenase/fumarate reductase flavoprotein subunit
MMQQLECDVLVIGGGLAGCWAALRAKELAPKVILVDIGKVSRSGKSSFSGAGILCPQKSDDLDVWHKEIAEKGEYLGDQDWIRVMLEEQILRLEDMGQLGLTFERDDKGQIVRHVGLNHVNTRITTVDSLLMMDVMRRRMEALGVTFLERVMITDLLTSDGTLPTGGSVVGAIGFNTRTGETFAINSGATVMTAGATGMFGAAGEGIVQAYRAGAELIGMEFTRCFDQMGFEDKYIGVHLNTYQRLGMRLVNSAGERFMEKYLPDLKERGKREDIGLAVVSEGLQGRAPIYMDLRHLDEESMKKLHTLPSIARVIHALEEEGLDFRKNLIKYIVTSGPMYIRAGGIRNNIYGESSVPGLYTAGEAGGMPCQGTYSVGGVNLASCCVGGYRAGEYAAKFAGELGAKPLVQGQAKEFEERVLQPLKATSGQRPEELSDEMHSFLCPAKIAVFRDARSIKKVLRRAREWKAKAGQLRASDYHELVKANRMVRYVECAEIVFRSGLIREESRGNSIRIDFPYKDNVNWLQWIVQWPDSKGRPQLKQVPVPLYRYPTKPKEYSRIEVKLPFPIKKRAEA